MKTELALVGALLLAAAAPAGDGRPPPPRPPPCGDWLRGGTEPEGVYGPRRTTIPARTLAASVRTRTSFEVRNEHASGRRARGPLEAGRGAPQGEDR